MATLISQTKWDQDDDGSPNKGYFSTINDGVVSSPYYYDNRDVPVNGHVTTSVPVTALSPGVGITIPGPAAEAVATISGVIPTGTSVSYGFTGPTIGTFGGSLPQNGPLVTAAEWGNQVAAALNQKHGPTFIATAEIVDDLNVNLKFTANDGSDVTINTWALI